MSTTLLFVLPGIYLLIAVAARRYNARVRLLLMSVSLVLPAWLYYLN